MVNLLRTIANVCESLDINWVIIGGLALPAYGVTRTTLDLDIAIYVKTNEMLQLLINKLKDNHIQTAQKPKISHLLFTVFSTKFHDEAEIWLHPCDAFIWDDEMIDRIKVVSGERDLRVLAPEDFIMTKLARMDRSNVDLQDIVQVILSEKNIDWTYLIERTAKLELFPDLQELVKNINKLDSEILFPKELLNT
jgi:hypothetical protein